MHSMYFDGASVADASNGAREDCIGIPTNEAIQGITWENQSLSTSVMPFNIDYCSLPLIVTTRYERHSYDVLYCRILPCCLICWLL